MALMEWRCKHQASARCSACHHQQPNALEPDCSYNRFWWIAIGTVAMDTSTQPRNTQRTREVTVATCFLFPLHDGMRFLFLKLLIPASKCYFVLEIVCISHKEDVDGIASAALVKAAFGATSIILSDYPSLISRIEKIAEKKIDKLFVCDLGLSKRNEDKFAEILGKIAKNADVTYIDHHDISPAIKKVLKRAGVKMVHTINECTSVQVYSKYKKNLPAHAAFLAAMGALTDYMETKPKARAIVPRYDRQFLMLEATTTSYMISASQKDDEFLQKIVDTLAKMKYPHDVKEGFERAEKYAKKVANAVDTIQGSIMILENVAHAPSTVDLSSSMVVNFVLGSSDKPAAMVYKLKEDIGSYVVSIRGSKKCKVHLGRLVNEITTELGGSGGGHDRACGAVIPKAKLDEFVRVLDSKITRSRL